MKWLNTIAGDMSVRQAISSGLLGVIPARYRPFQAVAIMAVIEAAMRSSQSGRRLELDLTRAERNARA